MVQALKSEFRKLLTVRSTYVATGLFLALLAITAFYHGFRPLDLQDPRFLQAAITNGALPGFAQIAAVISILLVAHEYRYNTINYTVTLQSRTKVFLAKIIVALTYTIAFLLAAVLMTICFVFLGLAFKSYELAPQSLTLWPVLGQLVFYASGTVLAGMVFIYLFRSIAAAIVTLIAVVNIVEGLLGLLIKPAKAQFLPFHLLQSVISAVVSNGNIVREVTDPSGVTYTLISANQAMALFTGYILLIGLVVWQLFLRRDAN